MQAKMRSRHASNHMRKTGHNGFTCDECGETFSTPILARVLSGDNIETYDACPRCMTKVPKAKVVKSEGRRMVDASKTSEETKSASESSESCGHFLGYLGKRPKTAPIPDTCFVCAKMVECSHG